MKRDDVERLADESTLGLRDDAELRLDVRRELLSHLDEAAAAARADGKTEEESLAHAATVFGSPVDVADALLTANRRRMRLRSLARLGVRALLVPAAVVVAVACVVQPYRPLKGVIGIVAAIHGSMAFGPEPDSSWWRTRLTSEQRLILEGDPSKPNFAEQQKAIWEAHPENLVFYANYVTALFARRTEAGAAVVERELLRGQELEPANGRYHYLLAALRLDAACAVSNVTDTAGVSRLDWQVLDREALDRAMPQVLKGAAASWTKTYSRDMLALRLSLLPEPETLGEQIARISLAAGTLLPDCASMRGIARASILYARLLAAEGRKDEALKYLEVWEPLSRSIAGDSFTLIELLVSAAIVDLAVKEAAPAAEAMGEPALAETIRVHAKRAGAPAAAWRAKMKLQGADAQATERLRRHAGLLAGLLLPALGEETPPEQLAPSRHLEHVVLERAALALFMVVFLLLMLFAAAVTLFRRLSAGPAGSPMLLLPREREAAIVVLAAAVLPVALYYVYTRFSGVAAQEYGWQAGGWRALPELWVLATAVLSLSVLACARFVHRRCASLGVPVPSKPRAWLVVLVSAIPLALPVWLLAGQRRHAAYRATLTRSLIPAFAAVVIVVSALGHPYLAVSERSLVRGDPLINSPGVGFTAVETRLVQRLKAEMLAGFEGR